MLAILLLLVLGIAFGYLFRDAKKLHAINNRLTNISIYALLFLLGVSLGANDEVLSVLPKLGWYALALSLMGMAGSILLAALLYHKLFKRIMKKHEK